MSSDQDPQNADGSNTPVASGSNAPPPQSPLTIICDGEERPRPEAPVTGRYEEIFKSEIYTFLVGKEEAPFYAHGNAFGRQSAVMKNLIYGDYTEKKENTVRFESIEQADFLRLMQFVYTGDYDTPPCSYDENGAPLATGSSSTKAADEAFQGNAGFSPMILSKRTSMDWKSQLVMSFTNLKYCRTLPSTVLFENTATVRNSSLDQNFTPVFLGHAHQYILGEMYDISALRDLSLHKLHETLNNFDFHEKESRIVDVIELLRFAYEHTNPYTKCEPLRKLVLLYVGMSIDSMGSSEHFYAWLREGGDFAVDFWKLSKETFSAI